MLFQNSLFGNRPDEDSLKPRYLQDGSTPVHSSSVTAMGTSGTSFTATEKTMITSIIATNSGSQSKDDVVLLANGVIVEDFGTLSAGETHNIYLSTPIVLETGQTITFTADSANASSLNVIVVGWSEGQ